MRTRSHTLKRVTAVIPGLFEWMRFVADSWVLVPAAERLPQSFAFACADVAAGIALLLPSSTSRLARAEAQAATGSARRDVLRLAWKRLASPRRDLVSLTRMARCRDPLESWQVVERNAERVRPVLNSGESLVLVTGHFSTAAFHVMQKDLPRAGAFVRGEAALTAKTVGEKRRQLEDQSRDRGRHGLLGAVFPDDQLTISVPDVWGPGADWSRAESRAGSVKQMLSVLRNRGGIVVVRIDAEWAAPGAYNRPFAGRSQRSFALGSARVARLSQCHVIPFVAVMGEEPRTVILEWGEPIPPPERREESGDARVIDEALTFIENGVARHATQYQPSIGTDRRWQESSQRWV